MDHPHPPDTDPAGASQPEMTPAVEQALARYVEIQEEMRVLQEEKNGLRDVLALHLAGVERCMWFPVVRGDRLRVRYTRETVVEYNAELLRRRLGDRYTQILAPDIKRIRRHLGDVAPVLAPVIETVGSVSREKVRAAIEQGVVQASEFAGAFEKQVKPRVAVTRLSPQSAGDSAPAEATPPW